MTPQNPIWDNNELQFARLIDECDAAGVFHNKDIMETLKESMNLSRTDILSIVNRATNVFEKEKEKLKK